MGNIYCEQQQFGLAVKCYRMALDAIPPVYRRLRLDVKRNMATTLFRAGRHQDAVEILQGIMAEGADHQAAFNLAVCCCAMRDAEMAQEALGKLLAVPPYVSEVAEDSLTGRAERDGLQQHLLDKQSQAER